MKEYDYIVVGGGSSGAIIAARLSESGEHNVLLLEAGGDNKKAIVKYTALAAVNMSSKAHWRSKTVPLKHADGKRAFVIQGRGLGGGSSINGMFYTRGHREIYDEWEKLGNTGWGFDGVLPYFKKLETYAHGDAGYRGHDGPVNICGIKNKMKCVQAFVESAKMTGLPVLEDINTPEVEGVGYCQLNQSEDHKYRQCTSVTYLDAAKHRGNLTILCNAVAQKILISEKTVTGVNAIIDGTVTTFSCKKEVIISAGALVTPQLLMLSGIGPASELNKFGIDIKHELPGVGQNLHDHPVVFNAQKGNSPFLDSAASLNLYFAWNVLKIPFDTLWGRKNILTANFLMQAMAFAKIMKDSVIPDIQFIMVPGPFISSFTIARGTGFSIAVILIRPESRGAVTLSGETIYDNPVIDPNYFSEKSDVNKMIAGLKLSRNIFSQAPLARLIKNELSPGDQVQSDSQIHEALKKKLSSSYHYVGTCKMGKDKDAVVDPELKVYGIERLRVADASVMPVLPAANTNCACMMIGEKAADMILKS